MTKRTLTAGCLVAAVLMTGASSPAQAQLQRVGASFSATGGAAPTKRRPDVAYDPTNHVHLMVTGSQTLWGRFVAADGTVLGGLFPISSRPGTQQMPRVGYSPHVNGGLGGFLVTWLDWRTADQSQVYGRVLAYGNDSQPNFITNEFVIAGAPGGAHSEMGPAVEYASTSHVFLVSWMQYGIKNTSTRYDIRAQRVGLAGELIGGEIVVTADPNWQADPAIAYNGNSDEFFLVYASEPQDKVELLMGVRIAAGTGVASPAFEINRSSWLTVPNVQFNAVSGNYLVAWYQYLGGTPVFYSRLVGVGGAVGGATPLAVGFPSYDGLAVVHNPYSNSYLAVFHDGVTVENMGTQLAPSGVPDPLIQITGAGGSGNFNPRIAAASDRSEWLVVTARSFSQIIGQRVSTGTSNGGNPPPPPPQPPPPPTSAEINLAASQAPNSNNWMFAEGAGGGTLQFDTYYEIENPNVVDVTIRTYFARASDGFTITKDKVIPKQTRQTIRLRDEVADDAYSVIIQSLTSGHDVFVERSHYWGKSSWGEGGTIATGENTTRNDWYFAEGTRKNNVFDNFFLVFNPSNTQTANVTLTFYRPGGAAPVTRTSTIAPRARLNFWANTVAELANEDFATKVSSDIGVITERSMYWGKDWEGGTSSFGAAGPASTWYFAEGAAAPNFDTFITVLNSNPFAVTIDVTYLGPSGQIGGVRTYSNIPANSRFTLWLTGEVGYVGAVGAKIVARNGAGVICERSTYWGATHWVEGANAVGVTDTAPVWHLPAGITRSGFDTFLLISNPNNSPVRVRVTPILENGAVIDIRDIDIPALGRETIWMNLDPRFPSEANTTFSIKVETLLGASGVVVEHAIYWNRDPTNYWRGGDATFGLRRPH